MGKNIIVTAGPTNEKIDAVMKITNMSTGALGAIIVDTIINQHEDDIGTIFYISTKLSFKPKYFGDKLVCLQIESADDLLNTLEDLLTTHEIDTVIHSSAVGDYVGQHVVRAEDIVEQILTLPKQEITKDSLMQIFTDPNTICNNSTKISSYEPNLMVKLTLTPKVISHIKATAPGVKLIGFKLLEGVSEEELCEVAHNLLIKNNADYIVANLLNEIGNGKHFAIIIDKDNIVKKCYTKQEIANAISNLIF